MSGLRIPYGTTVPEPAGPAVIVTGAKLRLSVGPYPFPEPPDLVRLPGVTERLGFLRAHLQSLCGLWDKLSRVFLDAYFDWIVAAIAENEAAITTLAARSGGLFAPVDWSFMALRPLPQAHLAAGEAPVRVDVAFWTGDGLVAIELVGSATPRRQRRDELARLRQSGVTVLEVPGADLQKDGPALLGRLLPPAFQSFWDGIALPASPFRPQGLEAFEPASDQIVVSST